MLIVSNVLEMNGGTTFILRLAKEYARRGKRVGVLVLIDKANPSLASEIAEYADIYYLKDYLSTFGALAKLNPLATFMPFKRQPLLDICQRHGNDVHVLGVFGLIFAKRLVSAGLQLNSLSAGIYHQNEFMFNGVDYYFAHRARKLFAALHPAAVILFNQANGLAMTKYFGQDYSQSTLVPIGIDEPTAQVIAAAPSRPHRIVSIGNLEIFKTYNEHVIGLMPELLKRDPQLTYEVYGTGANDSRLRELVRQLKLEKSVNFHGAIAYSRLPEALCGALCFVGSGTAILESAVLGIPSITGIESSTGPVTFGYISEVEGFSYNEMMPGRTLFPMLDRITSVLDDQQAWLAASKACREKALTFTIAHTADGFEENVNRQVSADRFVALPYNNAHAALSFAWCAALHVLKRDRSFMNRRDQGTLI